MANDIVMPKLGLLMKEGTVLEWQVKEGQAVAERQVVAVIESEKTAYDVESRTAGILHIIVPEGSTVPVGEVIGKVADSKDEYSRLHAG